MDNMRNCFSWVRGTEVVRRAQGFAQALFDQFTVAAIAEPDAIDVHRVLQVAHGIERHVDDSVDVVVIALFHFGVEHADNGKKDAIQANGFAQRPAARKQLGLGFGGDDADVGALLFFGPTEKAALIGLQLQNFLIGGADPIDLPCIGVQIVLHRHFFPAYGRNMRDAGNAVRDAVQVVQGQAHLHASLVTARLFARAARKDADGVGAPLGKNGLEGAAHACAVGQQQHHRGDAPGHADHGDGRAAAVEEHRLPRLTEYVLEHDRILPASS
jgi:hypothetical protein